MSFRIKRTKLASSILSSIFLGKFIFKVFGEHTFPKFTFEDIKNNKRLMYDINPVDLVKIAIDDHIDSQKKSLLKISEILRDNKYKISDGYTEEILSGDEICDDILLIEKIKNIDLYKIVYNTGFNHGRHLAKEIIKKAEFNDINHRILTLKCIIYPFYRTLVRCHRGDNFFTITR